MDAHNPELPVRETYRGVDIFAFQSRERIESTVKPAIDHVFTIDDADALWRYVLAPMNPPEARIWGGARLTAMIERRADKRLPLLDVTARDVRAAIAGLNSHWADPAHYASLFDHFAGNGAVPRPPEYGREMSEYFSKIERDRLLAYGWKPDPDHQGKLMAPGTPASAVSAG
jgi:hypothetical protein